MTKDLVIKESYDVVPAFMADAVGMGQDDISMDDIKTSFVSIAQSLSPQLKKQKAEYIEGLEEGMIFNKATNQIYGSSVEMIPIAVRRSYIEWKANRGGFAAEYTMDEGDQLLKSSGIKDSNGYQWDKGGFVLSNGNILADTFTVYAMEAENYEPIVFSLSSSNISAAKDLNSKIKTFKIDVNGKKVPAPIFARTYKMNSIFITGENDYYKFQPQAGRFISADEYELAKMLRENFEKGSLQVDHSQAKDEDTPF